MAGGKESAPSDCYVRVDPPRAEQAAILENEVRITTPGKTRNYISYATALLTDKKHTSVALKAMGQAINKTVTIAEIIKRRIPGLHQETVLQSLEIKDTWQPFEEGLNTLTFTRHVSVMSITLSTVPLDPTRPGYQAPLPLDQVKPLLPPSRSHPGAGLVPRNIGGPPLGLSEDLSRSDVAASSASSGDAIQQHHHQQQQPHAHPGVQQHNPGFASPVQQSSALGGYSGGHALYTLAAPGAQPPAMSPYGQPQGGGIDHQYGMNHAGMGPGYVVYYDGRMQQQMAPPPHLMRGPQQLYPHHQGQMHPGYQPSSNQHMLYQQQVNPQMAPGWGRARSAGRGRGRLLPNWHQGGLGPGGYGIGTGAASTLSDLN